MGGIDQPIRILVIEDVAPLRCITVQVLTSAGYAVSEAATGADGLRLAREQLPALILLDVGLPDINGVQVCHTIKADPETATTFVVLFSGSDIDTLSQASGLEAGADGYIARPISNRELVARVEAILRLKHTEDALRCANEQLRLELAARLRSEEAARQSETHLRIVANNTFDWEFWISPEDAFLYCSPSCQEITGHPADEFLARPELLEEIIHPDDLPLWISHKDDVPRSGKPGELEFRITLPGGTVRWLEHVCRPVYDADGRYLGRRGSCRDITKRHDAEAAREAALRSLQESEARFRMLVENQGEGIGIVDPTEHFVFANPAAETIFGVPQGHLVGCSVLGYLPREQQTLILEQTARRRSGERSTYEIEIHRPDGKRRTVLVTATPHLNASGEFAGAFVVFRDITDRKQMEAALRESEGKFRTLSELTNTAILIVRSNGRILYVNPAVQKMTGYTPQEIQGNFAWPFIHPEDREVVRARSEARLRGESEPARYRIRILTKAGETRWVDFTSALIEYAGEQVFLNTAYDVTDLIRIQEAEREQRILAEALRDTAAALASPLGFEAILDRIIESVGRVIRHDAANILLIEEGVARVVRHHGYVQRGVEMPLLGLRFPVAEVANLREMAVTGSPTVIEDTRAYPGWLDTPATRWIRSYVGAPIQVGGETIGFLSLDSAQSGFFTPHHAEQLQAFAYQAGMALENARLLDETQRRADQFARLYEIARELSGEHDPLRLAASIATHARALLRTSGAQVYLYDSKREDLELAIATDDDMPIGLRVPIGQGMAGRVAVTRQPMVVRDYEGWPGRLPALEPLQISSVVQAPLVYGGTLIGVMAISERRPTDRKFGEGDRRLLNLLAIQAAGALHDAQLYQAMQNELVERQRVQEELRQSENLYRLLAENSTDVIWKLDIQTLCFTYVSPAITKLRGLTVAEALAEPIEHAVDPQSLAYIIAQLPKRLAAYAAGDTDAGDDVIMVRQPHKDGAWIDVEIATTLLTDEHGQPAEILGVSRDITARRQVEDEVQRSREMLRTVLDTIPQRVFWKDRNSIYLGANKSYAQDTGLAGPEEVIGKTDAQLGWSEYAERFQLEDQQVVATDAPLAAFDELIEIPDSKVRWQRIRKAPLHDAQGQVVGVLGVYEDITAQRRAQERLQELVNELARSNAELEHFAYAVSHDLQEPLRMVASFVQLLGDRYRGQLDADADDFIGFAVDGAERMQRLISDLLEYSRVTTRGQPLQETDAEKAIEEAARNLELAIEEARAQVTWDPLPKVMADATQLMRLFQNLISNAIKFHGSEPPQVHVSVQRENSDVSHAASGTPAWVFSVQDNGIGIAPEHHERIFEVFQRLHTRTEYPGTGIGLAICKKIVERHAGHIWVESVPDHGASFCFTIPSA